MNAPLVSVVMPTRNRAAVAPRAITSVIAQTFTDWELIVVDDASTDDTPETLIRIAASDARIRRLRLKERGGAPAARNVAIQEARGEYIAFLDDDDEWFAAKLRSQVDAFGSAPIGAGVVYGSFLEVNAAGVEVSAGDFRAPGGLALRSLVRGNRLGQSTVMVRRSVLDAAGTFDEQLPRLQDWDLWIRLAMHAQFVYVPGPLARIHLTPGSISADSTAIRVACLLIAAKYDGVSGLPERDYAELCYALGQLLIRHGFRADGRSLVGRALRLHPWPPTRIAGGLLLLAGQQPYFTLAALYSRFRERRSRSSAAETGGGPV